MRDHRQFAAFKHADKLAKLTYDVTRHWPRDEQFGLTSQVRRGSVSVVSNIVEGCGRETESDFRHFLVIAHSACRELDYQFSLAAHLQYPLAIGEGEFLSKVSDETCRVLAGLIKSIPPKGRPFS